MTGLGFLPSGHTEVTPSFFYSSAQPANYISLFQKDSLHKLRHIRQKICRTMDKHLMNKITGHRCTKGSKQNL